MANKQSGAGNVSQNGDGDKTNIQIINVTPPPAQPPNPPEGDTGAKGLNWQKIVEAVIVAAIVGGGVFYISKNIIVVGDGNSVGNTITIPPPSDAKSLQKIIEQQKELIDIVRFLKQNPDPDMEVGRSQECVMDAISNDQYEEARRCSAQAQAYLDTKGHAYRLSMINKQLLDAQIAWKEAENPVTSATRMVELWKEAEEIYAHIDREFGSDNSPDIRERVALALYNKGVSMGRRGETKKALDIYDKIDRRYGKDKSPGVREPVASALRGQSWGGGGAKRRRPTAPTVTHSRYRTLAVSFFPISLRSSHHELLSPAA